MSSKDILLIFEGLYEPVDDELELPDELDELELVVEVTSVSPGED